MTIISLPSSLFNFKFIISNGSSISPIFSDIFMPLIIKCSKYSQYGPVSQLFIYNLILHFIYRDKLKKLLIPINLSETSEQAMTDNVCWVNYHAPKFIEMLSLICYIMQNIHISTICLT